MIPNYEEQHWIWGDHLGQNFSLPTPNHLVCLCFFESLVIMDTLLVLLIGYTKFSFLKKNIDAEK